MTCFGTSAAYIAALHEGRRRAGRRAATCPRCAPSARPARRCRRRASTGSTSTSARDTWLFSTSGGTDVCTAFVGGVPTAARLRWRAAGARARRRRSRRSTRTAAGDRRGRRARAHGADAVDAGLLLGRRRTARATASPTSTCTPASGATATGSRSPTRGTAIIYGRSDSTINRGGVRMGTSEIYRAVLALDEVVDALVVDVPREGEESWMPLFVVLADGAELDDELVAGSRTRIREDCSPRHVPDEVLADRRGPAHAVGQGARGAGQADPDGRRRPRRPRAATRSPTPRRSTASSSSRPIARRDRAGL